MGSEIPNPPERTWDQRNLIPRRNMGQEIPTPQKDMGPEIPYTSVNRLTDTCENITFPQLGLGFIYTRAKAKAKATSLPMCCIASYLCVYTTVTSERQKMKEKNRFRFTSNIKEPLRVLIIFCSQKFIHLLKLESGHTRNGGFILRRASTMLISYFVGWANDLP